MIGAFANFAAVRYNNTITTNVSSKVTPNKEIKIYPNPSSGKFTIATEIPNKQASIKIYDLISKVVYEEKVSFSNKEATLILNAASGIYIVELQNEEGNIWRERLMVK
jgi:hypothetical protein